MYGAITDHFSFADTNNKLQSSDESPAKSESQCQDSKGTIILSDFYDTTHQIEYTCVYRHCSDTAVILYDTIAVVDVRLGKIVNNIVINSITVTPTNTDRLEITIAGRGTGASDSDVAKFNPADLEISGVRKATPIGAIAGANTVVTGSTGTASCEVATVADSDGLTGVTIEVHSGRVEATTDFVGTTGVPAGLADTANGFELLSGIGEAETNTDFSTGAITAVKNLPRM